MAERVLDSRALNRAVLARQLLLHRARLPVSRAIERVAGLQTQYAPSGYIGLWSRLDGFSRAELTRALERGTVLQGTLMRATIHIVSAADHPRLAEAVRRSRRDWYMRVARSRGLDELAYTRAAGILGEVLRSGPRPRAELIEILAAEGFPKEGWEGVGLWIDMIRVPPSGTWERRRADLYGLAPRPTSPVSEEEGLDHLVRRYLGGFGPATLADISSWGGVPITVLQPVAARLRLRRMRDDGGSALIDLPARPLPDPGTPAPPRFLPTWDATLLAHARRSGILPEEYRSRIFNTKSPQSFSTFLLDGAVAGTWRREGGRVLTEPFAPIPPRHRRELEDEAARLSRFLAD